MFDQQLLVLSQYELVPEDTKRYQLELDEQLVTFILSSIWSFEEAGSGIAETGYFLIYSLLVCCGYFKFGGAGEAWPRSEHTGSSLPTMLRGKSPCLGVESATGRPEDLDLQPSAKLLWSCGYYSWSFAATKLCHERSQERQQNGAHSLHALLCLTSNCWCCHNMSWCQKIRKDIKLSSKRSLSLSFYQAYGHLRRLGIAETGYFLIYSLLVCCGYFKFWGAGEAWPRSEHTGSSLPTMLRGKSPCLGVESATGRPEDLDLQPSAKLLWSCGCHSWSFAATKLCHERSQERQQNGAHSLHALLCLTSNCWCCHNMSWCQKIRKDINLSSTSSLSLSFYQAYGHLRRLGIAETGYFLIYSLLVCCGYFKFGGAGEAWPRSEHTGSSLPTMLRGKSPCLGVESATGRPEDLDLQPSAKLLWSCGCHSWSFAATKLCHERSQERQQNGAHSLHALFCRSAHVAIQASLQNSGDSWKTSFDKSLKTFQIDCAIFPYF